MQRVFIVGGAGKIGRLLATELLQRDQQPFSLCRTKIQADELQALGAVPVMGDLLETNIAQMASKMEGCDAVVFAAGAGGKDRFPLMAAWRCQNRGGGGPGHASAQQGDGVGARGGARLAEPCQAECGGFGLRFPERVQIHSGIGTFVSVRL